MVHEFLRLSSEGVWRFDLEQPISIEMPAEEQVVRFYEHAVLAECNVAMAKMYGFSVPGDLVGRRVGEFLSQHNPANVAYLMAFVESEYHLRDAESLEIDHEGKEKYFQNSLIGIVEDGQLRRAWGMQRDVTAMRMAEVARLATDQLFRRLVDLVPQMLWICRADGSAEYWSKAGLEYFGRSTYDLTGWSWREVIHPDDVKRTIERWKYSLSTGELYDIHYRLRRFDGEYRWHLAMANCERAENGAIVRWYGTCTDIHDQQLAQTALSRAKDAAEEANRAKDQFLAVLSHELRTPLNPVLIAATELSQNLELPEEVREDARTIRQNVELEARIIDDLLDLTRITHGKLRMSFEVLDMHAALYDVLKICGGEAQRKGVALILDLHADQAFVEGDDARIRQVLWNLLNNAIKFTPEGGRVLVRTQEDDASSSRRIAVEVVDSGVGIDKEALGRIFHAFEQETAHGRRFGGLGLGLAISSYIAEAHGGGLHAHSEGRGHGAKFTFSLPVLEGVNRGTARLSSSQVSEFVERPCHVLLVEDHDDTRRLLARLLTKHGHSVRTAENVAEALSMGTRENFDLLISDIGLPDGSGYDVMRELRKRRSLPGIALTGYGMEEDIRRAADAGFGAHLTKPVEFEKLRGAISVVLGNPR